MLVLHVRAAATLPTAMQDLRLETGIIPSSVHNAAGIKKKMNFTDLETEKFLRRIIIN